MEGNMMIFFPYNSHSYTTCVQKKINQLMTEREKRIPGVMSLSTGDPRVEDARRARLRGPQTSKATRGDTEQEQRLSGQTRCREHFEVPS